MAKIGVFDSGVGGESVVNAIQQAMPNTEVIYVEDKKNVPYGTKTPEELYALALPLLNTLSNSGCDVIVVACNTVTTTIIEKLRASLPVPLIGVEPMIKPAAEQSKSGVIAVCATPATLRSPRYAWLKDTYAKNVKVLEPDCSDWAYMIETQQLDHQKIQTRINEVCQAGADMIVLGCTHYHWIEQDIQKIADEYKAKVIQPEQPVIEQLKRVTEAL
jgi:glutamate racemase